MQISVSIGTKRPKLKDINRFVSRTWAPRWRQLGVELGLDHGLTEIIEYNHPNDCETCCREMFTTWLDVCPDASWEMLINAIDKLLDGKSHDMYASKQIM